MKLCNFYACLFNIAFVRLLINIHVICERKTEVSANYTPG